MANKKNNGYKPSASSHSKATRVTVLVLAFLMVAGILATMIGYIVYAIIGDDGHDHDAHSSSSAVSVTASSNNGTTDVKPSSSSTLDSTTDSKPATSLAGSTLGSTEDTKPTDSSK